MINMMHVRKSWLLVFIAASLVIAFWQGSSALADVPEPNPSVRDADDARVPGAAASIHGNPAAGQRLFAQNCASCHGVRGVAGVDNPGSEVNNVPSLTPLDADFLKDSNGDAATVAERIDLFVQHGSQPSGGNPQLAMPGWGDEDLLTQQQIADIEAYVMQLNGLYWPDQWNPPVEIRMRATRDGDTVTYQIGLVNHSAGPLCSLDLKDTLPAGLTYVTSYIPQPRNNPGDFSGSTVEWLNNDGVPPAGTFGPFIIVTKVQGTTVPPNSSELFFTWVASDGTTLPTSAVSDQVLPGVAPGAELFGADELGEARMDWGCAQPESEPESEPESD